MTAEEQVRYRSEILDAAKDLGIAVNAWTWGFNASTWGFMDDVLYLFQEALEPLPAHPKVNMTFYNRDTRWDDDSTYIHVPALDPRPQP